MIKFNKHNVTDTETKAKCRVYYDLDNRIDDRKCVTLYAKDYSGDLFAIFPKDAENDSDLMIDYFEKDQVNLFEDHPEYAKARLRAESV